MQKLDSQREKSMEGQVTEASTSCSNLVSSAAPDTEFVFSHGLFFDVDKR